MISLSVSETLAKSVIEVVIMMMMFQIKSIFVYLMEKIPRLSQMHKWFTEYYSVDNVTQ